MHFEEEVVEIELELSSDPVSLAMTRDRQGCLVLDASGYIQAHDPDRSFSLADYE